MRIDCGYNVTNCPAAAMKKILKYLGYLVGVVLLAVGGLVATCALTWAPTFPDTPKPDIKASDDPAVIERGKYLVNAVAHCAACHSPAQEYAGSKPGEIVVPKGGHEWHMGPIGVIRAPNITPHEGTGIGKYTDAELARVIRHGVKRNDEAGLFMMAVGPMSDEDLTAVVSYIRSIEPVDHAVGEHEVGLLGKVLFQGPMKFFSHPHDYSSFAPTFVKEGSASAERGKYLAHGPAFCVGCHSDYEAGDQIELVGPLLSGNVATPTPDEVDQGYELVAPNLTPDPDTGVLASWTLEQFTKRMRAGRMYAGTPMPWETYANLTDEDIESLWLYLRSLPPTLKEIGPTHRKVQ